MAIPPVDTGRTTIKARTTAATDRRLQVAAIAITAGLAASGCASHPTQDPAPNSEPAQAIPYANVWSADPGIDLFSRGAELVRATMEAADYASYVGAGKSYPGYADAVATLSDQTELTQEPRTLRFVSAKPADTTRALEPETVFSHITAYAETPTTIAATVCGYSVGTQQVLHEDEAFRYTGGGVRIELENNNWDKGQPGIANPDPNHHDARAQLPPHWDVFGKWKITTIRASSGASEFPAECVPWYQQKFPTYAKDLEFNRLDAPPGYTVPHQPVAQQFPEWIGSSSPS